MLEVVSFDSHSEYLIKVFGTTVITAGLLWYVAVSIFLKLCVLASKSQYDGFLGDAILFMMGKSMDEEMPFQVQYLCRFVT